MRGDACAIQRVPQGLVDGPASTAVGLSVLVMAVLLAVVFQSGSVLVYLLCFTVLPLLALQLPTSIVMAFLFANLLIPKLPLIPIGDYVVPIRIEDVLLACTLLCLLVRRCIYERGSFTHPLQKWMLVFSGATLLSFLFGHFVLHSVPDAKVGFLYWLRGVEYMAASYLCPLAVRTWAQYNRVVAGFVVAVFLVGSYGILQEMTWVPVFDATHETGEIVIVRFFAEFGEERIFSTFGGPLDLPATCLIIIPLLTTMLVMLTSRTTRLLLAVVLALSLACFYLSYARMPLLALVVVIAICFWQLRMRSIGIGIGLGIALPSLLLSGYFGRIRSGFDNPYAWENLGGRMQGSWDEAVSAVSRSPLLGTGPASFSLGLGADGLYFMLVGIWGVLGLACFVLLLWKTLRFERHCAQTGSHATHRGLAVALFAGTIGLLVNGLTMDTFYSSKIALTFWFLVGLLISGKDLESSAAPQKNEPSAVRPGLMARNPEAAYAARPTLQPQSGEPQPVSSY